MRFPVTALVTGHLLAVFLLLWTSSLQARNVSFDRWKGEPPPPQAGARILAAYRIEGEEVLVWSRMPRRPYRVLGVLRSFETVGLSHQPLYRLAQEAHQRGGNAIVLLAPKHLPGSWIRGDDLGVTIHGQRFTVLVLRSASGALFRKARRSIAGPRGMPAGFADDAS